MAPETRTIPFRASCSAISSRQSHLWNFKQEKLEKKQFWRLREAEHESKNSGQELGPLVPDHGLVPAQLPAAWRHVATVGAPGMKPGKKRRDAVQESFGGREYFREFTPTK